MKKLILIIIAIAFLLASCTKHDGPTTQCNCNFTDFRYYHGEQVELSEIQDKYILIGIDTTYTDNQIKNFISSIKEFDKKYVYTIHTSSQYKFKEIPLRFKFPKTCEEITQIISNLEKNEIVAYAHYTMKIDHCLNLIGEQMGDLCVISYGSNFYVKTYDENNLFDLNQIILETNTEFVKQVMPQWFELRATKKSKGDALKMANYFYETGLFEDSEPGMSRYPVE
ncbi:hypothetical protein LJC30_00910 [Odoribacter sp. OttesenSCG-928-L07]|nr:hypothetical protein [Odoribacter sp. OttesenSCG-928-L07]MDL2238977.1 hypothetical protein [Bacteroidales bacterium OttesenSCG-928-L14]MDL2240870.1 hypothetical protein [Bacteroidales bacterium OttesenSCG-928-K22]